MLNTKFECSLSDLVNTRLTQISETFKAEPFKISKLINCEQLEIADILNFCRNLLEKKAPVSFEQELLLRAFVSFHPEQIKAK